MMSNSCPLYTKRLAGRFRTQSWRAWRDRCICWSLVTAFVSVISSRTFLMLTPFSLCPVFGGTVVPLTRAQYISNRLLCPCRSCILSPFFTKPWYGCGGMWPSSWAITVVSPAPFIDSVVHKLPAIVVGGLRCCYVELGTKTRMYRRTTLLIFARWFYYGH